MPGTIHDPARFTDWQKLNYPAEIPRYKEIGRLVSALGPSDPNILDVGCGEALLFKHLPIGVNYTGIEPSEQAYLSSQAITDHRFSVFRDTAEHFSINGRRWECVVLNEVLYYCHDPERVLAKYAAAVAPGGILIVSIYERPDPPLYRFRHFPGSKQTTNCRCAKLVEKFMQDKCLFEARVAQPGTHLALHWRIWVGVTNGDAASA
ncbi:MAG TPA: class I SAM-dependent methyltransferase [Candidatus Acidoferrum sp.]|nr:class I SAM-dependent methyltransferase [Candidatus Acidoferrum sp.]